MATQKTVTVVIYPQIQYPLRSFYYHPSTFFTSGFSTKLSCALLISPTRAVCPAHLILLDLIILTIFGPPFCVILQRYHTQNCGKTHEGWVIKDSEGNARDVTEVLLSPAWRTKNIRKLPSAKRVSWQEFEQRTFWIFFFLIYFISNQNLQFYELICWRKSCGAL
jgi:hypothetical protein